MKLHTIFKKDRYMKYDSNVFTFNLHDAKEFVAMDVSIKDG